MCGLVGIFDPQGKAPIDRLLLERMNRTQSHRGPDGDGMHVAPGIGLASTRLRSSISPPARSRCSTRTPRWSWSTTARSTISGTCKRSCAHAGMPSARHATPRSSSTPGGMGRGVRRPPARDVRVRALGCAAADPVPGARPAGHQAAALRHAPGRPAAVRLRAEGLLAHPGLPRRIDPCAVEDYLAYGYVPDPKTIYRDIRKLRPAHWLSWRVGQRGRERSATGGCASPHARASRHRARPRSFWSDWRRRWRCASSPTCRLAPFCPAASTPAPWSP